jgi:hypothetical protein
MSTSPDSASRQTLGQFAIAVVALVVGSAVLFFAIGAVGGSSDDEPAAAATTASATEAGTETPATTGSETEAPAQVVGPSDEATATAPASPTSGSTPEATSAPTTDPGDGGDDRVDPAEISVQVLDAIRDGSTTARDYADQLEAAGYDVVAFLRAGRTYDQTTVFYSSGREALARQVADEFGWTLIRANDVGLSEDVDVAVVVGVSQN